MTAHLHHFVDHVRNGRSPTDAALIAGAFVRLSCSVASDAIDPHTQVTDTLCVVGFQLLYTSVFGAYASFLFLRTGASYSLSPTLVCCATRLTASTRAPAGHFASIFVVHVFCNVMGLPDLSFFNPDNSLHPFRIGALG